MSVDRDHSGPWVRVVVQRHGRIVWTGEFENRELLVGRSPRSDVVLDDPQVSWTHALARFDASEGIVVSDRSSNGCFRDGERIKRVALGTGGVISIPPFEVDFRTDRFRPAEEPYTPTIVAQHARPRDADRLLPSSAPPDGRSRPSTGHSDTADPTASAELRFIQGPGALLGRVYPLAARTVTIGRAMDCDIRLEPSSVSRHHARLTPVGEDRWRIEDAGSENGIAINGTQVRSAEISPGDRIGFGSSIVAVLQVPSKPQRLAKPPALTEPTLYTGMDALVLTHAESSSNAAITVVKIAGRLDGYNYTQLRDEVQHIVDRGGRFLVADMSKCSFCDHAGLGALVHIQVVLRQKGGAMCVCGLSSQLGDAFRLLRLDHVLSVSADEREAVAYLERVVRSSPRS